MSYEALNPEDYLRKEKPRMERIMTKETTKLYKMELSPEEVLERIRRTCPEAPKNADIELECNGGATIRWEQTTSDPEETW